MLSRGGGSLCVPSDYSPPPPACSLNFGETPASMGSSVSFLSQSQSTKSNQRCVASDLAHAKKPVRCKRDAEHAEQEDDGDDDNDNRRMCSLSLMEHIPWAVILGRKGSG